MSDRIFEAAIDLAKSIAKDDNPHFGVCRCSASHINVFKRGEGWSIWSPVVGGPRDGWFRATDISVSCLLEIYLDVARRSDFEINLSGLLYAGGLFDHLVVDLSRIVSSHRGFAPQEFLLNKNSFFENTVPVHDLDWQGRNHGNRRSDDGVAIRRSRRWRLRGS